MIFKKKPKPQQGLRDSPESMEYKKNIKELDLDFNSDKDFDSQGQLPEIEGQDHNLPPLDREDSLEMPPQDEKKIRKIPKEKEIFVKMDNFKNIVQSIENMEQKLEQLENLMQKLQKLNDNEVQEINSWKSNLDDLRGEIKDIGDNLARE